MQGQSLLGPKDGPDDIFIQISESQVGRALRHKNWKYCVSAPDGDPYFHAGSDHYRETHLYDLENDPWELENLVDSAEHQEVRKTLADRLIARMVAAGEQPPQIEPISQ